MATIPTFVDFYKMSAQNGMENTLKLFYSVYHAIVAENDDPEQQGRIKVRVPQITGNTTINEWILPMATFAGNGVGFFAVPNIDDGVWVSFKNGNPRFPVYMGGWWKRPQSTGTEVPQPARGDDYPNVRVWATNSGHYIALNDAQTTITIMDGNGNRFFMENGKVLVENDSGGFVDISDNLVKLYGDSQPAVLGDNNGTLHNDHITQLINVISQTNALIAALVTAFTAIGTALPPAAPAAAAFTTSVAPILSQLATITSTLNTLITTIPQTKSNRVKLS